MFKKRLLILAEFLETKVPRRRFSMITWADGAFCGRPNEHEHHECKTTACAMGWACTLPVFKKAGLKLVETYPDPYDGKAPRILALQDNYDQHAAAEACGITYEQAIWLFGSEFTDGKYRDRETPKQVAKRIRAFVASNGAIP